MLNKKDGVSLVILVVALVLINVFGNSLDEMMWTKFTLLVNCILSQCVYYSPEFVQVQQKPDSVCRFDPSVAAYRPHRLRHHHHFGHGTA